MAKSIRMKVGVFCEESQEVCKAFRERGHEAFSIDIQGCSGGHPEWHIKSDALKILYSPSFTTVSGHSYKFSRWDLAIAHPPCTRMANSGVRWLASRRPRQGYSWSEKAKVFLRDDSKIWEDLDAGVSFLNEFIGYGKRGNRIAIEQPVHHKYATKKINHPYQQIIQPYQFGHMEKKATTLWLFGLRKLVETNNVYDEMMKLPYAERAKIHTASPGPERARIRSKTYQGVAKAMADQWPPTIWGG